MAMGYGMVHGSCQMSVSGQLFYLRTLPTSTYLHYIHVDRLHPSCLTVCMYVVDRSNYLGGCR